MGAILALISSLFLGGAAIFVRKKTKPETGFVRMSEKTPVQTMTYHGEDRRKKMNQMQYRINEILRTNPNAPKRRTTDI